MSTYHANMVSVADGDTVHMDLQLMADTVFHQDLWRRGFRYRLARCNAPEMSTPEGKVAADALKAFVATFPLTGGWTLSTAKPDPYGRYIAEVVTPTGVNLSDWVVANGYAVPVTYRMSPDGYLIPDPPTPR